MGDSFGFAPDDHAEVRIIPAHTLQALGEVTGINDREELTADKPDPNTVRTIWGELGTANKAGLGPVGKHIPQHPEADDYDGDVLSVVQTA